MREDSEASRLIDGDRNGRHTLDSTAEWLEGWQAGAQMGGRGQWAYGRAREPEVELGGCEATPARGRACTVRA